MKGKTDTQFLFEVGLNSLKSMEGVLFTSSANGPIYVAPPEQFGGPGKRWTPEHLFLGSISSCFMTTYLAFAKKVKLDISQIECNTIGQIEIINGAYKFTNINLYPKVYITLEEEREKANLSLEKTHKYCLITNSINAAVYYHSEILLSSLNSENETGYVNKLNEWL